MHTKYDLITRFCYDKDTAIVLYPMGEKTNTNRYIIMKIVFNQSEKK